MSEVVKSLVRCAGGGGLMPHPLGFFDSCTYHPDAGNSCLIMAEKMSSVRRGLREIIDATDRLNAPILATSCLGILRGNPTLSLTETVSAMKGSANDRLPQGFSGGTAYVPMNATEADIAHALTCKRIVFERLSCKSGDENVRLRTYDVFGVNKHAREIVRRLGMRHWLVFGAGFDHCLVAAVEGLRQLGMPVSVLSEGCINGGRSTPATTLASIERIRASGAKWSSLPEIIGGSEPA